MASLHSCSESSLSTTPPEPFTRSHEDTLCLLYVEPPLMLPPPGRRPPLFRSKFTRLAVLFNEKTTKGLCHRWRRGRDRWEADWCPRCRCCVRMRVAQHALLGQGVRRDHVKHVKHAKHASSYQYVAPLISKEAPVTYVLYSNFSFVQPLGASRRSTRLRSPSL